MNDIVNDNKGHNIVNDKIADGLFVVSIWQELIANSHEDKWS